LQVLAATYGPDKKKRSQTRKKVLTKESELRKKMSMAKESRLVGQLAPTEKVSL
jgi:hypothetical protein